MSKKINGKTSKKDLVSVLTTVFNKNLVTDENLNSRVKYSLDKYTESEKSVSRVDLFNLCKEVSHLLYPKQTAPVETSTKLKHKENAEKKVESKAKPEVATISDVNKVNLPIATIFPKEIDHESFGKLVACHDKYHTVDEIRKALDENKNLVFATYWTKRHLKEFNYAMLSGTPVPKEGFPYNLDTLQTLYVCDGMNRVYALSTYTEAMFQFNDEDLAPVECEAPDGTKFSMRYSAGMEFEVYEVVS